MARKSKWQEKFSANQRYGKWVIDDPCVISRDGRGEAKVWATCDCRNQRHVYCSQLANGKSKSCGCAVLNKGVNHPAFKGDGVVSKTDFSKIVRSLSPSFTATTTTTAHPYTFNLSPQLLNRSLEAQNFSCSVTSQPIDTTNATLSCLNNSGGYVSGNIIWIHNDIKAMQGNMDMETFVAMCRKVVDAADTLIVPPPKSDNPIINATQQIAEKYNGNKSK